METPINNKVRINCDDPFRELEAYHNDLYRFLKEKGFESWDEVVFFVSELKNYYGQIQKYAGDCIKELDFDV